MSIFSKKPREHFCDDGNKLIAEGKTEEAMRVMERGFDFYSDKITKSYCPFATSDSGMIIIVLRHLADEIERQNPWTKKFVEGMEKAIRKPELNIKYSGKKE